MINPVFPRSLSRPTWCQACEAPANSKGETRYDVQRLEGNGDLWGLENFSHLEVWKNAENFKTRGFYPAGPAGNEQGLKRFGTNEATMPQLYPLHCTYHRCFNFNLNLSLPTSSLALTRAIQESQSSSCGLWISGSFKAGLNANGVAIRA